MRPRVHAEALVAVILLACAGPGAATTRYVAVPLGTLGGAWSEARAINDSGEVTGSAQTADGIWHAFLFTGGKMRDLDDGSAGSTGNAINVAGHVTGCAARDGRNAGFVHFGDVMHDIATLAVALPSHLSPSSLGCGVAIDDADRIVGEQYWDFQYAPAPSYLYAAGRVEDAPQTAAALNKNGDIAGTAYSHFTAPHAWVFVGGVRFAVKDAGESYATAVNANGQATGAGWFASSDRKPVLRFLPFVFDNGVTTPITAFPFGQGGFGAAINARGHVVGWATLADATTSYAFVAIEGDVSDLNSLVVSGLDGAVLTTATGINDAGMIVANSCSPGPPYPTPCVAYRLEPLEDPRSPANVPTLSVLLLAALALLVASAGIAPLRR
jgi:probable HAF family extracellular repeat protein